MKILITSPHTIFPRDSGGVVRTVALAKALSQLGHEVLLLSPRPEHAYAPKDFQCLWYRRRGRIGHFFNPSFTRALQKALDKSTPQLIIMEFPFQSRMVLNLAKLNNIPVIYDAHNIEALRFQSMANPLLSWLVSQAESYLCKNCQTILAVSQNDKEVFDSQYGQKAVLLPNGINNHRFYPKAQAGQSLRNKYNLADKAIALFCGNWDYKPNVVALKHLLKNIWPKVQTKLPEARLIVVGKNPPKIKSPDVITTGFVENLPDYLSLANVILAPIMAGGGTRLKIIEALSCGQIVIATPFAATGLSAVKSQGLHCVPLEEMADTIIKFIHSPPCSNHTGAEWAKHYDWQLLAQKMDWEKLSHWGGQA